MARATVYGVAYSGGAYALLPQFRLARPRPGSPFLRNVTEALAAGCGFRQRPGPVFDTRQQLGEGRLERPRKHGKDLNGEIALAVFRRADVGAVDSGAIGEVLLGPSAIFPETFNPLAHSQLQRRIGFLALRLLHSISGSAIMSFQRHRQLFDRQLFAMRIDNAGGLDSAAAGFFRLGHSERVAYLRQHHGFLSRVKERLAALGINVTRATMSRTWHGQFRRPNADVVTALEDEFQGRRLDVEDAERDDARDTNARGLADELAAVMVWGRALEPGHSAPIWRKQVRTPEQLAEREAWLRERLYRRAQAQTEPMLRQGASEPTISERRRTPDIPLPDIFLTVAEVAQILALSDSSTRLLFEREPGVLRLGSASKSKLRIPLSVLQRVIRQKTDFVGGRPVVGR